MRFLSLAIMLFVSSCQSSVDWQDVFYQKGQEAMVRGDDHEVYFYHRELLRSSDRYKNQAQYILNGLGYEQAKHLHVDKDDNRAMDLFNRMKNCFVESYDLRGTLDEHVVKLKEISKIIDPKEKGFNVILRVAGPMPEVFEAINAVVEDDPFAEETIEEVVEDGFGDDTYNEVPYIQLQTRYISFFGLIERLCLIADLKYKITEHAVIIADRSIGCGCGSIIFLPVPTNDGESFIKYLKEMTYWDAGAQISYIASVNRLVVKNTDSILKYLESFVVPNFEEVVEIEFYKAKNTLDQMPSRVDLEKNLEMFHCYERQKLPVVYGKPRIWRDMKFTYTVKNKKQKMRVDHLGEAKEFDYLGITDQVIKLDDRTYLLLKIR